MIADNYYEITSLPSLGELSASPPFGLSEYLSRLENNKSGYDRVSLLFLYDDLLQRQGFLSGELKDVTPSVLTVNQLRNEEPLPDYLISDSEPGSRIDVDNIWDNYFHYVDEMSKRIGSEFLRRWVSFEVGLRNALAIERAKSLGLEPQLYLVAEDLQNDTDDFSSIINEYRSAQTPLDALKTLLKYRWEWAKNNNPYFSFESDELAAYGLSLMLLIQWHRLEQYRSSDSS